MTQFKETASNGVTVIIEKLLYDGRYKWLYTNHGTKEERAQAIDEMHEKYNFVNWESPDEYPNEVKCVHCGYINIEGTVRCKGCGRDPRSKNDK